MLILKTLGFTCLVSGTTMIIMFMWLAFNSKAFFDKQSPRYYEVTMGNPLNAAFDDGLLTERGLRWRRGMPTQGNWPGSMLSRLCCSIVPSWHLDAGHVG